MTIAAAAASAPAAADTLSDSLLAMRSLDRRVAGIGHRLAVAANDLCVDRQWRPGFAVHHLSQYGGAWRDAAIRAFGLSEAPAVLALAPGGPAERAGLHADDALVSADGEPLPNVAPGRGLGFEALEPLLEALERAFGDGVARIEVHRAGAAMTFAVEAELGCASRFQVVPSSRLNALADGRYVQITTAIGEHLGDDQELAAVLAHEFAHNILNHRARLDEAGAARGFFGNFGRSARLIRATEEEADRLSVHLLDRAGYDPEAAERFWSRFGRRGFNFLNSPTHPGWRRRIALFRAELEAIRRARAEGRTPAPTFLERRAPAQDVR